MTALLDWVRRVKAKDIKAAPVVYGPWAGSMRSKTPDKVPREFIATGSDFLYVPRTGRFRRRQGQTKKFDSGNVGLLPAKWGGRARWGEEFVSESISDATPTTAWLVTKETMAAASVLDDGRFSTLYLRDQYNSLNYTLGSDYGTTTYPALGSAQTYKVVPLWYDSGDGGITRGTSEYLQRFLVSGSRRNLTVGNWMYHPSLNGTPSRWRRRFVNGTLAAGSATHQYGRPTAFSGANWKNQAASSSNIFQAIDDSTRDDADYITEATADIGGSTLGTVTLWAAGGPGFTPPASATTTFRITAKRVVVSGSPAGTEKFRFSLYSGATLIRTVDTTVTNTASFDLIEITLTAAEFALFSFTSSCTVEISTIGQGDLHLYHDTSWMELDFNSGTTLADNAIRIMPTGPLPALHSGSLAKGTVVSDGGAVLMVPTSTIGAGGWTSTGANLWSVIDETSLDTLDYIQCNAGGTYCEVKLSTPTTTPTPTDTVQLIITIQSTSGAAYITMNLYQNATLKYAETLAAPASTASVTHTINLTSAQINSITDWTDLRFRFAVTAGSPVAARVSRAVISTTQFSIQTQGGFKGSDRFYHGTAFRFEDGSIWAPCVPRPPSTILPSGFNLFTVDIANPNTTYDRVTWSNIPIGPHGTVSRLLLRTQKISAVKDDNLQISPTTLQVTAEIEDNTTTTYEDFGGADADLAPLNVQELFIRYDHMMAPRARYIFGGDMRVCHSYGGDNPSAIILAPVGQAADYDLNVADDSSTGYAAQGSWMQIKLDTSGAGTLTLIQGDGATATNTATYAFATYTTLQKLVDVINATSFASDGQQWRAQIAPGANPDASSLSLCPHNRAIANCVVLGQTISKAAGGLSKVAVGQWVGGTGVTSGAYITSIDSDTQLTFTGTITAATKTLYFFNPLGDTQITTPATDTLGFQRVTCGALPGFLYFTKTYLSNQTLDKQSVWMTVAPPGGAKSAANCFSAKSSNRFMPTTSNAGISMGGAGVDQGFVTPYSNQIHAIVNKRDMGTGVDSDYRMVALNESSGCCAWNTVVPGNRFVPYLKPEGMFAADLSGEMKLSDHTYDHGQGGTGDFTYEAPLAQAATAQDVDYLLATPSICAYASARIMRGALHVNYRSSGSAPNRRVVYDFSTGNPSTGLAALVDNQGLIDEVAEPRRVIRRPGDLWGWSTPLVQAMTAMCEGRRSDGSHIYGWSDANAGSAGDGRLDEFEVTNQDNGAEILGTDGVQAFVGTPIERLGLRTKMAAQGCYMEHKCPVASTGFLEFHRGATDTAYQLTPATSATDLARTFKDLPQDARVSTDRFYLKYTQTAGDPREVRLIEALVKSLPDTHN